MRDRHRLDELILERGFYRRLDLLNIANDRLDLAPRTLVQKRHSRAGSGRIAGGPNILQLAVRNHAKNHRIFWVDMGAERAGQHHPVHLLQPHLVHQQTEPGMQRRLCQLDSTDIILRDHNIVRNTVGECAAILLDPRRACHHRTIDHPVGRQNAGDIHLGQHLDNAGPANAGDASGLHRRIKAILIRPFLDADHPKARLQRILVDTDPFNCARRGTLA